MKAVVLPTTYLSLQHIRSKIVKLKAGLPIKTHVFKLSQIPLLVVEQAPFRGYRETQSWCIWKKTKHTQLVSNCTSHHIGFCLNMGYPKFQWITINVQFRLKYAFYIVLLFFSMAYCILRQAQLYYCYCIPLYHIPIRSPLYHLGPQCGPCVPCARWEVTPHGSIEVLQLQVRLDLGKVCNVSQHMYNYIHI